MKTGKYIFTLEYEGNKKEFNTILKRQSYIKENSIKSGICKTYIKTTMEQIASHSFNMMEV